MELLLPRELHKTGLLHSIHSSCSVFVSAARQDTEVIKFLITSMSNLGFQNIDNFYDYAAQRCLQKLRE